MKKSLNSADLGLMSSRVHSGCIPPVCIRAKRRRKWPWVLDTLLRWLLPIKFLGAFVTHTPRLYPCNGRDLVHEYAKQPNFTFTSYRSWVSPCQINFIENLKRKTVVLYQHTKPTSFYPKLCLSLGWKRKKTTKYSKMTKSLSKRRIVYIPSKFR